MICFLLNVDKTVFFTNAIYSIKILLVLEHRNSYLVFVRSSPLNHNFIHNNIALNLKSLRFLSLPSFGYENSSDRLKTGVFEPKKRNWIFFYFEEEENNRK